MDSNGTERASPGRVVWQALWTSRLVVLSTGVLAALSFGRAAGTQGFDPGNLTASGSYFGNLLASPFARWDSVWYLAIANDGYPAHDPARTAFFPVYPLMMRGLGVVLGSDLVAGVVVSLACLGLGLLWLYQLVALELDDTRAQITVMLLAFCPMAYFFSAVYSESLFLVLSVGCIYQARMGRWVSAGVLGGIAAASRNSGVMLAVPMALLYLYGPREDQSLERSLLGWRQVLPRYPIRPSFASVLLVPAGLAAYVAWLGLTSGDGLAPFHAQQVWFRSFAGPFGGVWTGTVAAWDGLRQLLHGPPPPLYFTKAGGDALSVAGQNLFLWAFLILGLVACAGVFRTLPFAYGGYVVAALALPLSYPVTPLPLASLPRYEVVLFPLFMWGAVWTGARRNTLPVLGCFAVLLGLFTAEFATWRFVA